MEEGYALLHATEGYLLNIMRWDGNTATWNPPEGTIAVKLSEIDIESLPPTPDGQYGYW